MSNYGDNARLTALRRLGIYGLAVAEDDLAAELDRAALTLSSGPYADVGAYEALSMVDATWFDIAVGTLTAMSLAPAAASLANDGMTRFTTVDQDAYFAGLEQAFGANFKDAWESELKIAIGKIAAISALFSGLGQSGAFDTIRVNGYSRTCSTSIGSLDITGILPIGWGLLTGSPWLNDDSGVALADLTEGTFYGG